MAPDISLRYSHNSGPGYLGMGWSIDGPKMFHRCEKIEAIDGYNQNFQYESTDAYCLDGQRVLLVSGEPGQTGSEYRLQLNGVDRITILDSDDNGPLSIQMRSKGGVHHVFDVTQYGKYASKAPIQLKLSRSWDGLGGPDSGIYYHYSEVGDTNQFRLLEKITYNDGNASVVFDWKPDSDAETGWFNGRKQEDNFYLDQVDVVDSSTGVVWNYALVYKDDQFGDRYLTEVRQCDADKVYSHDNSFCLPPLVFEYQWQSRSTDEVSYTKNPTEILGGGPDIENRMAFLDLNRNGVRDQVRFGSLGTMFINFEIILGKIQSVNGKVIPVWDYRNEEQYINGLISEESGFSVINNADNIELIDINGDGYEDIVLKKGADVAVVFSSDLYQAIQQGGSWWPTYNVRGCTASGFSNKSAYFADLTGNGVMEYVCEGVREDSWGHIIQEYREWTGDEFGPPNRIVSPGSYIISDRPIISQLVDLTGNGVPELISHYKRRGSKYESTGVRVYRYVPTRSEYESQGKWVLQYRYDDEEALAAFSVDFNRDGTPDILYKHYDGNARYKVLFGKGDGTFISPGKTVALFIDKDKENVRIGSHFGRGISDVAYTFDGYAPLSFYSHRNDSKKHKLNLYGDEDEFINRIKRMDIADLNGNGVGDIYVLRRKNSSSSSPYRTSYVFHSDRGIDETFLKKVSSRDVNSTEISYESIAGFKAFYDNEFIYARSDKQREFLDKNTVPVHSGSFLVSNVKVRGKATGNVISHLEYQYGGLRNSLNGRGNLGLGKVVVTDHFTNRETVEHRSVMYPFTGKQMEAWEYIIKNNGSRQLLNHSENEYCYTGSMVLPDVSVCNSSSLLKVESSSDKPLLFAHLSKSKQTGYELDGTKVNEVTVTNSNFDKYMNVGRIVSSADNLVSNESYTTDTVSTYYPANESEWIVDRVESTRVTHALTGQSPITKKASFGYFDNGLLQWELSGDRQSEWSEVRYAYDGVGNITSTTTNGSDLPSPRVETYVYDPSGRFIEETLITATSHSVNGGKKSFTQKSTATYDPVTGFTKSVTSPALQDKTDGAIRYEHNWFGEVIEEWRPGVKEPIQFSKHRGATKCQSEGISDFAWCQVTQEPDGPQSIQSYNRQGQLLREAKESLLPNHSGNTPNQKIRWVYTDFKYDARGNIAKSSRPYYKGAIGQHWVESSYDDVNRVTKMLDPWKPGASRSQATTVYSANKQTLVDRNGVKTERYTNVLGEMSRVIQDGRAEVRHEYYADGLLKQTTQLDAGKSYVTSFTYDILGNKSTQKDPAMGTWSYTHNGVGEVIEQVDARGTTTTSFYDESGRLYRSLKVSKDGKRQEESLWEYDTQLVGLLSAERHRVKVDNVWLPEQDVTIRHQYDKFARPEITTQSFDDDVDGSLTTVELTSSVGYDDFGRVVKEVRPDGFVLYNEYQNGYLHAIKGPSEQHNLELTKEEIDNLIRDAVEMAEAYTNKAKEALSQAEKFASWAMETLKVADSVVSTDNVNPDTVGRYGDRPHAVWRSDSGYLVFETPVIMVPIHGEILFIVPVKPEFHYLYNPNGGELLQISADEWNAVLAGENTDYGEFIKSNDNAWFGDFNGDGRTDFVVLDGAKYTSNPFVQPGWQSELNKLAADYLAAYQLLMADYERYMDAVEDLILLTEDVALMSGHYELQSDIELERADLWSKLQEADNDGKGYLYYWKAQEMDASGRVRAEVFGNGVSSDYYYFEGSGQLMHIDSRGPSGASDAFNINGQNWLRQMRYGYDRENNVTNRENLTAGITETFKYDRLGQLREATYYSMNHAVAGKGNRFTEKFEYDNRGNFTQKDGVIYHYGNRAYAPERVGDDQLHYNENGSVETMGDRRFEWDLAERAEVLHRGQDWAQYSYIGNGSRYRKVSSSGERLYYFGKSYERRLSEGPEGAQVEHHNFINVGGRSVAVSMDVRRKEGGAISKEIHYFHNDALNSVDLITNARGQVVSQRLFDPWGKARAIDWQSTGMRTQSLFASITNRGFTGHEHIAEVGLIHMNARVYDPTLGIFLSADPVLQDPENPLNYNRYTYVWNNPMKYHDPSGNFITLIGAIVVGAMASSGYALAAQMAVAFAFGYVGGKIAGQSDRDAFFSGLTSAIFVGVGSALGSGGLTESFADTYIVPSVVHGFVGGTLSAAQGGDFTSAFLSSAIAKGVTPHAKGLAGESFKTMGVNFGELAIATIAGGLTAEAGGGKFKNGARTAALANLFNEQNVMGRLSEYMGHKVTYKKYSETAALSKEFPVGNWEVVSIGKGLFSIDFNTTIGPKLPGVGQLNFGKVGLYRVDMAEFEMIDNYSIPGYYSSGKFREISEGRSMWINEGQTKGNMLHFNKSWYAPAMERRDGSVRFCSACDGWDFRF
ncbi:hypothetical protein GCM10023333_06140 [Ferrimonas pelagia]|uniref:Insecticide toxin TcdB middle/N-terminal domain-containing protein n=2 Tax=Ferrimonas pelagia TaxID=1177826 RepID=A0ABP9ECW6_9GAMM